MAKEPFPFNCSLRLSLSVCKRFSSIKRKTCAGTVAKKLVGREFGHAQSREKRQVFFKRQLFSSYSSPLLPAAVKLAVSMATATKRLQPCGVATRLERAARGQAPLQSGVMRNDDI